MPTLLSSGRLWGAVRTDTIEHMSDSGGGLVSRAEGLAVDLPGLCDVVGSDAERIDALAALEALKSAACAAQARLSVAFAASQEAEQREQGVPARRCGRGVAVQIGLARRESPHQGGVVLGLAKVLVAEMPYTLAALQAGVLNEYRAMLLVRETACLSREDRARVDELVCGDRGSLEGLGTRQLVAAAKQVAYRLDPAAIVERSARAERERGVSLRPAPDAMTYLTALLPLAQGVACLAALRREAASVLASGDGRGRGQVMADTLVERVTGQAEAGAVPVGVFLVMDDHTLLDDTEATVRIVGHGPLPAGVGRRLVGAAPEMASWVRRLYRHPATGELVGLESKARCFPAGLGRFIQLRDEVCRTPFCGAPIRHIDHILAWVEGGATTATNGQGLCEACNHAKQAPGWHSRVTTRRPDRGPRDRELRAPESADREPDREQAVRVRGPAGRGPSGGEQAARGSAGGEPGDRKRSGTDAPIGHEVATVTPTGHEYRSRAPAPPDTSGAGVVVTRPYASLGPHRPIHIDFVWPPAA